MSKSVKLEQNLHRGVDMSVLVSAVMLREGHVEQSYIFYIFLYMV